MGKPRAVRLDSVADWHFLIECVWSNAVMEAYVKVHGWKMTAFTNLETPLLNLGNGPCTVL